MRIPLPSRRMRWLGLIGGGSLLIWLTTEDNAVLTVTLLGLGLSVGVVGGWVMNRLGGRIVPNYLLIPGAIVPGALIGLGASLATAGLMLFKNALHAHLFLDFPPGILLAILERAPVWTLVGALAGFGLALLWVAWGRSR